MTTEWLEEFATDEGNNPRIITGKSKADNQWYNRLVAGNNYTLMISEAFPDRSTAEDNITAIERAMAAVGTAAATRYLNEALGPVKDPSG